MGQSRGHSSGLRRLAATHSSARATLILAAEWDRRGHVHVLAALLRARRTPDPHRCPGLCRLADGSYLSRTDYAPRLWPGVDDLERAPSICRIRVARRGARHSGAVRTVAGISRSSACSRGLDLARRPRRRHQPSLAAETAAPGRAVKPLLRSTPPALFVAPPALRGGTTKPSMSGCRRSARRAAPG